MTSAKKKPAKKVARKSTANPATFTALAQELGISRNVFNQLKSLPDSPKSKSVKEWQDYLAERTALGGKGSGKIMVGGKTFTAKDIIDLRGKLLAAQAEGEGLKNKMRELELREKTDGLVPMSDAKQAIAKAMTILAALLENMPKACCVSANPAHPELAEKVIRDYLKRQVYAAIKKQTQSDEE